MGADALTSFHFNAPALIFLLQGQISQSRLRAWRVLNYRLNHSSTLYIFSLRSTSGRCRYWRFQQGLRQAGARGRPCRRHLSIGLATTSNRHASGRLSLPVRAGRSVPAWWQYQRLTRMPQADRHREFGQGGGVAFFQGLAANAGLGGKTGFMDEPGHAGRRKAGRAGRHHGRRSRSAVTS